MSTESKSGKKKSVKSGSKRKQHPTATKATKEKMSRVKSKTDTRIPCFIAETIEPSIYSHEPISWFFSTKENAEQFRDIMKQRYGILFRVLEGTTALSWTRKSEMSKSVEDLIKDSADLWATNFVYEHSDDYRSEIFGDKDIIWLKEWRKKHSEYIKKYS